MILDEARDQMRRRDKLGQKEAIHQLRVAMKRMRALLRLVKSHVNGEAYAQLDKLCRTLSDDLAINRDSDVVLDTLQLLAADSMSSAAYLRLHEVLRLYDGKASSPATPQTPDWQKTVMLLERIDQSFSQLSLKNIDKRDLRKGVERGLRKGSKLWRQAQKRSDTDILHDWRKVVKCTLYQKQLLWRSDRRSKLLKSLGSCLGDLHDLDMLEQHLLERRRWIWQEDLEWLGSRVRQRRERLLGQADQCAKQIYIN
ncbi:CHAD domain-containing protein [Marinobacterium ramblicola]|uniref:CHAD domain-containing protein n=1 Tax=Marinobacterium ramblicola TaxID=2849041 RepID=UPI0024848E81|nr:CHAD domain-containing protein [Marinobacterium ramblicola]